VLVYFEEDETTFIYHINETESLDSGTVKEGSICKVNYENESYKVKVISTGKLN
jgi:ribosomal 50S subunit-recycling heat shock protein